MGSGQTARSVPQQGNPTHMGYPAHTGMASMGSSGLPVGQWPTPSDNSFFTMQMMQTMLSV